MALGVVCTGQRAFPQSSVDAGMGNGSRLSRMSARLLASITTGFPEEETETGRGMGTRKWLDRWGVGGSSQHMGLRGRKESEPGEGEGTQGRGDSPRSRGAQGSGSGRVNRSQRGGGKTPKARGWGVGAALEALTPEPAEGAARRSPCTRAPPDGASRLTHGFHFLP